MSISLSVCGGVFVVVVIRSSGFAVREAWAMPLALRVKVIERFVKIFEGRFNTPGAAAPFGPSRRVSVCRCVFVVGLGPYCGISGFERGGYK